MQRGSVPVSYFSTRNNSKRSVSTNTLSKPDVPFAYIDTRRLNELVDVLQGDFATVLAKVRETMIQEIEKCFSGFHEDTVLILDKVDGSFTSKRRATQSFQNVKTHITNLISEVVNEQLLTFEDLAVNKMLDDLIIPECPIKPKTIANYNNIFDAIKNGDYESVKYLVFNDPYSVNSEDPYTRTPIFWAIEYGHLNIVNHLIENGAQVNVKGYSDLTPLHLASKHGRKDIVILLLRADAESDATDSDGCTPLHIACENAKLDVARVLISHGANINAKSMFGLTPLDHCLTPEIRAYIQENGGITGRYPPIPFELRPKMDSYAG